MATEETTTTTTTTTTTSDEKKDPNRPQLKSSPAISFWEKNFGDKEEVPNDEFQTALQKYLQAHKSSAPKLAYNQSSEATRIFAMTMTQQIFWPFCELNGKLYPTYVDKSCIQFAINTFGPWTQIFQTIHKNLEDEKQPLAPLQYFHGRTPKKNLDPKLHVFGNFALRYGDGGTLILAWARAGKTTYRVTRDEKLRRRKLKGKKGKPSKIVWTWDEKTAGIGGTKIKSHNFKSVGAFITHKKGGGTLNKNSIGQGIKDPVMFASAYKTFEPDPIVSKGKTDLDDAIAKAAAAAMKDM